MYPTLVNHDRVLMAKLPKHRQILKRFDVIVFYSPRQINTMMIKRVIGLPGETVAIQNGATLINGHELKYPPSLHLKTKNAMLATLNSPAIPPGHYFLLGDNSRESIDSRFFGPVDESFIRGKVVFRYWPINKIGPIR